MITETAIMKIYADAMEAARLGDKIQALTLADRFAAKSLISFSTASPTELLMIIAVVGLLYKSLEEWELVVLKMQDVCALAERFRPNSSETAGDYTHLATALENLGHYNKAISALEAAVRHLRGAGTLEEYAAYYNNKLSQLRTLAGTSDITTTITD